MPPCEPLTTTAPIASGPTRVMLSAVRIGGSSGTCPSQKWRSLSCGEKTQRDKRLSLLSGRISGKMLARALAKADSSLVIMGLEIRWDVSRTLWQGNFDASRDDRTSV